MNAEFVNPFLQALQNVMSMMAQTELKPGKPQLKKDDVARGDVSGIIGMVGPQIKGSFSISFEENLACEIMNKMLGEMP
ncbi:MAG TPA: chemotaxis protein CheX, partial [Idiomarina sp.]|nr:chemotaxis protein CheX [Idiomarina sp.]